MENKFTIWVYPDRLTFLREEMKDNISIIGEDVNEKLEKLIGIEIVIKSGYGILQILHTGMRIGRQEQKAIYEKSK